MNLDDETLEALDDETPELVDAGELPLTAGDVRWLKSAARHMGISFAEAVAWAVQQHKGDCLHTSHVERSLRFAEAAAAFTRENSADKAPAPRR